MIETSCDIFQKQTSEVSCIKRALRDFAKFIGEHLLPQACNFIKKDSLEQAFSYEFFEIFKNTFFIANLQWLLLIPEKHVSNKSI